jgi:hypothetical protein
LENPVPSQAGHLISATASFDLSLFIKIALQKEPWYPSRGRTPTPFPPSAILGAFLVSAKRGRELPAIRVMVLLMHFFGSNETQAVDRSGRRQMRDCVALNSDYDLSIIQRRRFSWKSLLKSGSN